MIFVKMSQSDLKISGLLKKSQLYHRHNHSRTATETETKPHDKFQYICIKYEKLLLK